MSESVDWGWLSASAAGVLALAWWFCAERAVKLNRAFYARRGFKPYDPSTQACFWLVAPLFLLAVWRINRRWDRDYPVKGKA